MFLRRIALIIILLLITTISYSVEPFEIRVIYFQPTDAPDAPIEQIGTLMLDTQEFYGEQMEKLGYGYKTFRVENENGDMLIHTVKGKNKAEHYFENTVGTVLAELPREFTWSNVGSRNNVHVFIVGGLDLVQNGVLGLAVSYQGLFLPRHVFLPGDRLNVPIIAHEIGHTFGLFHNGVEYTMMGVFDGPILDYEARWISVSPFLNDRKGAIDFPRFLIDRGMEAIDANIIRFEYVLSSNIELHQFKIVRDRLEDDIVIGSDNLSGKHDIAQVNVSRGKLVNGEFLFFRVIDVNGNLSEKRVDSIKLPYFEDKEEVNKVTTKPNKNPDLTPNTEGNKNPDLNIDNEEKDVEAEDIEENIDRKDHIQCPGCIPEDETKNRDLVVSVRNKLTTKWASIKRKRN